MEFVRNAGNAILERIVNPDQIGIHLINNETGPTLKNKAWPPAQKEMITFAGFLNYIADGRENERSTIRGIMSPGGQSMFYSAHQGLTTQTFPEDGVTFTDSEGISAIYLDKETLFIAIPELANCFYLDENVTEIHERLATDIDGYIRAVSIPAFRTDNSMEFATPWNSHPWGHVIAEPKRFEVKQGQDCVSWTLWLSFMWDAITGQLDDLAKEHVILKGLEKLARPGDVTDGRQLPKLDQRIVKGASTGKRMGHLLGETVVRDDDDTEPNERWHFSATEGGFISSDVYKAAHFVDETNIYPRHAKALIDIPNPIPPQDRDNCRVHYKGPNRASTALHYYYSDHSENAIVNMAIDRLQVLRLIWVTNNVQHVDTDRLGEDLFVPWFVDPMTSCVCMNVFEVYMRYPGAKEMFDPIDRIGASLILGLTSGMVH